MNLREASYKDKNTIVNILVNSFKDDPQINWMLEKASHPDKLNIIMSYVVDQTFDIGKIMLTEDLKGTALWTFDVKERFTFNWLKRNLNFLFKIGINSVVRILKNEAFTYKQFPKGKFAHLYLIGVHSDSQGKGYGSLLMNSEFEKCEKSGIPVYLETANPVNVSIYEKKGFKTYKEYSKKGLNLFYMRKE